jgi:hypothetical protein
MRQSDLRDAHHRDKISAVQWGHCTASAFAVMDFDCCPHPQPEAPAAFAFASSAQQASVPTGAGPPQQWDFSTSKLVVQTPVSGSTSLTAFAASRSPAKYAAIDRTCSYPVAMRNGVTLQSLQFGFCFDHLNFGENLWLPEDAWWRPMRRSLLRD